MKNNLAAYLDNAITFLLFVVAGVTPLLFLTQTTEFFEMPKLIFLVVATVVLLGLWIFSWIVKGKVVIHRTPLDIPLLILLVVVIISTWFSATRFPALYGSFPRVHGSAVSWVTYILLYFVTVSHLTSLGKVKNFLLVLYGSGLLVALVTLMSFFGIFFPMDFAKSVTFTPTGSSFSTVAFLLLLLPLPILSLARSNKYMPTGVALPVAILFAATVGLVGSFPSYIILALIFVAVVMIAKPHTMKKTLGIFLVPVITTALIFVMAYLPLPGGLNKVQSLEANFPKEIQLPFDVSWQISASAFRDNPFVGSGPATYLFNFTSYKPANFNSLAFWNFSFDSAYNEFLQTLGTLGILGLGGLVLLGLIAVIVGWRSLMVRGSEESQETTHVLLPGLALSSFVAVALLAVHATTLVSLVATLFVLGALMMSQRSVREHASEFSIGIKASLHDNRQFDLLPVVLFILFLIGAVIVLLKTYTTVSADVYHRLALSQANKNGTATYQYLQKAESLNPTVDLYRVDMAQTNFALANALAAQNAPTKANPNGTLTDQDKKTIQTLLAQAVNEGRVSVALSPRSSRNWEVLGSIYRNISGVAQNALAFSLDAYGHAIQLDPLNPALRVSVGGIYYAAKNYQLAVRFYSDAANLKPDYANAYYNLAIALRDSGDLQNGKLVADQLVTLLQKNVASPDYKAAVALQKDLQDRLTAAAKTQANSATPAGQESNALQNSNLNNVNVSNLNNPPQVTPAPAVKTNPEANLPQAITSPSPTPAK